MNAQTLKLELAGPSGALQGLRDSAFVPEGVAPRGVAVIAHPHPLFGGTMDNKVVQTLARAFVQSGWDAVRFNFRGVGASAGAWDEGRGEIDDFLAVLEQQAPQGPIAIAGFSFGALRGQSCTQGRLVESPGGACGLGRYGGLALFRSPELPPDAHERTLAFAWRTGRHRAFGLGDGLGASSGVAGDGGARRGHFFHGQLPLLKALVLRHLRP